MDGEIEFLRRLGDHLRRVAEEETAHEDPRHAWRLRRTRIRALPAVALAIVVAIVGFTLWTAVPGRDGTRTQSAPGDGQEILGPAAAGPMLPPTGWELSAVDAASADDVWAVGTSHEDETYRMRSLILHWDGQTWSRVSSPDVGGLTDVAAVTEDAAWAMGGEEILRWDGASWEVSPNPAPPGAALSSIDASGPDDAWVVGMRHGAEWVDQYGDRNVGYDTLTMHWDGNAWTIVPSPNAAPRHNFVEAVLALSPTDAWVVGYSQEGNHPRTLTMHWDGSAWTLVPSPDPGNDFNVLWGTGTDGADGVWALGHYGYDEPNSHVMALYMRWTGGEWEVVPAPSGDPLHQTPTALSGAAPDDVWAVGSEPTSSFLVAHWDGSTWSSNQAEIPAASAESAALADVATISTKDAWAVGRYVRYPEPSDQMVSSRTFALIEHWDGVAWRIREVPQPDG